MALQSIAYVALNAAFPEYVELLFERMRYFEVGFTGHVSAIDEAIAKDAGYAPLTHFEKWLMRPTIDELKTIHHDCFREACMEVLGEDPDDWGRTYTDEELFGGGLHYDS